MKSAHSWAVMKKIKKDQSSLMFLKRKDSQHKGSKEIILSFLCCSFSLGVK